MKHTIWAVKFKESGLIYSISDCKLRALDLQRTATKIADCIIEPLSAYPARKDFFVRRWK